MPRIKDLVWLDTNQTEAAPSTASDTTGAGASYPNIIFKPSFDDPKYILLESSASNRTVIPLHRVIKVTLTDI
jgi:hypothetical protein